MWNPKARADMGMNVDFHLGEQEDDAPENGCQSAK
jgi:hypothetical protein